MIHRHLRVVGLARLRVILQITQHLSQARRSLDCAAPARHACDVSLILQSDWPCIDCTQGLTSSVSSAAMQATQSRCIGHTSVQACSAAGPAAASSRRPRARRAGPSSAALQLTAAPGARRRRCRFTCRAEDDDRRQADAEQSAEPPYSPPKFLFDEDPPAPSGSSGGGAPADLLGANPAFAAALQVWDSRRRRIFASICRSPLPESQAILHVRQLLLRP